MDTIPTAYFLVIYTIMAMPMIVIGLSTVSLLAVVILYSTNRRKAAIKLLKILSVALAMLIVLTWLARIALGV